MNKKLLITIIGILAILSLSIGAYYTVSLNESSIENITKNNDSENITNVSENNSKDNNIEKSASGNSHNTPSKQNNSSSSPIDVTVESKPVPTEDKGCS